MCDNRGDRVQQTVPLDEKRIRLRKLIEGRTHFCRDVLYSHAAVFSPKSAVNLTVLEYSIRTVSELWIRAALFIGFYPCGLAQISLGLSKCGSSWVLPFLEQREYIEARGVSK